VLAVVAAATVVVSVRLLRRAMQRLFRRGEPGQALGERSNTDS
jgi:hypothetical protein